MTRFTYLLPYVPMKLDNSCVLYIKYFSELSLRIAALSCNKMKHMSFIGVKTLHKIQMHHLYFRSSFWMHFELAWKGLFYLVNSMSVFLWHILLVLKMAWSEKIDDLILTLWTRLKTICGTEGRGYFLYHFGKNIIWSMNRVFFQSSGYHTYLCLSRESDTV